ncbi:MAG: cation-translocating P-type ATPase [Acidobacteria bacterium]|nr:cation-translocating P-type ATPase [Acidobacteriota bacterium]
MSDSCCDQEPPHADASVPGTGATLWDVPALRTAALSGGLLLAALAAYPFLGVVSREAAFVPALLVGASTFAPQSARALFRGRLGVGTLMSIAALGAAALGQVGEAASLAFLFSISEALEAYALTRTRRGLRALLSLVPPALILRRGGEDRTVELHEASVGELMVVRPGDRVATDGVIRAGQSSVDLSAITGESVPVERGPGDPLFAGSLNGSGVLEVEITAAATDNSLARVVRTVEEAQDRKAGSQRLAEGIARPLVPGVMVLALLVAAIGSLSGDPSVWIYRSLVVLVAAAPCAFAMSVPVGVVAAIGAATRAGVLIKGGIALEALEDVEIVAFDKTGTLTRNAPHVLETLAAPGYTEDAVLSVAGAMERDSGHPLARAVLATRAPDAVATGVEAVIGHGLTGYVSGLPARLGKPDWIDPGDLSADVERLQEAGATVIVIELGGKVIGAIAVRDELREEATDVVSDLRRLGVRRVVMLTGDNPKTAGALGRRAQVDEVHAGLLPEGKASIIERLALEGRVAMIGDGINDAPALATATVGIAMGAMGSDVAIEAADVAFMGDDLRLLPATLVHAKRAMRIVRQNLFISGVILATLVPLAALGLLKLAVVIVAHEVAEVLVIANGLRAGRSRAFQRKAS